MPYPIYASQHWVCVANPGGATLETIRTLLAEAHDRREHRPDDEAR